MITAWKVAKYGVFSGPYFPVFSPNAGKYGPEKTPYLDTFHAVDQFQIMEVFERILGVIHLVRSQNFPKN